MERNGASLSGYASPYGHSSWPALFPSTSAKGTRKECCMVDVVKNNGILHGGFFDLLYNRQVACTSKVVVVVAVVFVAPAKMTF